MAVEFKRFKVGEKARVQMLAPTVVDFKDVEKGDLVETSVGLAYELIYSGKAKWPDEVAVPEPEPVVEAPTKKAK